MGEEDYCLQIPLPMYGQAYRRKRLSRTDWMVIGIYWLIVLPLIYLTNIHVYELATVLKAMAFTFILDSALVLTVLYILPSLFTKKKYVAILMLSATILVFGLVYMIGYSLLYRSEEHTSVLHSLMRISYAVFCLQEKTKLYPLQATSNMTISIYVP